MNRHLEGAINEKVALITGSERGIGRAIAELFAEEKASVVITARTEREITTTVDAITTRGGRALGVAGDLSEAGTGERLVEATLATFGCVDILVNNAAVGMPVNFSDTLQWENTLTINLLGAVRCARAVAPRLPRGGRIINVSSIHGYRAEPGASAYDVAKGGLDQLTRSLAVELSPREILVNGIAPGFVRTAMSWVDGVNELETDYFQNEYVGRRRIPLARSGLPEEIAWVALFLAHPRTTYITGHVLVVDGGLSVTF